MKTPTEVRAINDSDKITVYKNIDTTLSHIRNEISNVYLNLDKIEVRDDGIMIPYKPYDIFVPADTIREIIKKFIS